MVQSETTTWTGFLRWGVEKLTNKTCIHSCLVGDYLFLSYITSILGFTVILENKSCFIIYLIVIHRDKYHDKNFVLSSQYIPIMTFLNKYIPKLSYAQSETGCRQRVQ